MRWLVLGLMFLAILAFGQARWSSRPRLRAACAGLGVALVIGACLAASSPGPAVMIGGLAVLTAARGGETSRQAIVGFCGIILTFAGALLTRAGG